jgi:hypothetical protein
MLITAAQLAVAIDVHSQLRRLAAQLGRLVQRRVDLERVHVHQRRNDEADDEEAALGARLVPSGDALHDDREDQVHQGLPTMRAACPS